METKIKNKYEVGDKVYKTYRGVVNNLFYEPAPLTIRKVDYNGIYPLYFFEEMRGLGLEEKDLTGFYEMIPKLEKHIEDCKTLLEELKHAQAENDN